MGNKRMATVRVIVIIAVRYAKGVEANLNGGVNFSWAEAEKFNASLAQQSNASFTIDGDSEYTIDELSDMLATLYASASRGM